MNEQGIGDAMAEYESDFGVWRPLSREEAIAAGFPPVTLDGEKYDVVEVNQVERSFTIRPMEVKPPAPDSTRADDTP